MLCLAFPAVLPILPVRSIAQVAPIEKLPESSDSLESRIRAAQQSRSSRDPAIVARANRLAIAAALRQLGDLKVLQSDFVGSIHLYMDSLGYEDSAATIIAMGLVELRAGHFDKAIELGTRAHAVEPTNLTADRLLASALDQKGDYAKAVGPFTWIAKADPSVDNLYPLAECLLQTRKPEDRRRALHLFDQMRQIGGESGSLHVLMGRSYRDGGDLNAAIAEFRRAIALDSRTPHAHYFLGLAQLFANDWKPTPAIEADIRKELDYYPDDYLANYMLGVVTAGERKFDDSDQYLETAAHIDPDSPDPILYLGMNAYAEEKMARAEAMMRKAIVLTGADEARTNYQIRRAYVDLSRILGQSGRMEESKVYAAKARELQNKTMVATQAEVSRMITADGGGMGAAVVQLPQEDHAAPTGMDNGSFANHRRLTPDQLAAAQVREKAVQSALALAFNDLATAEAIQKKYPEALADYHQAEHWDISLAGLHKNLGLCAFRVKDYAEAARSLVLAVAEGDNSAGVRAMLGLSYFALDKYPDAVHAFNPLGDAGMKDAEVGYAWAASLARTGDMKSGAQVLLAFGSEPRPNDVLLLVGQLWTEIGDFARAEAALDRALAVEPTLQKAHFYKGLACLRAERWSDAEKEFQAELHLNPADLDAMYHLGFVEQEQSKTNEALALYLKVIAANPRYVNAQYEAGKIYFDLGQDSAAAQHLEAASRLTAEKDYIHYQLQLVYRKLGRTSDADRELEIYKQMKMQSRQRVADAMESR